MGDLGTWFPDTDPAYAGADSIELLRSVAMRTARRGWSAMNIDCSVVCEQPKLAPHRDEMQRRLTGAVGAPVTVKGRRAEGLGVVGSARRHCVLGGCARRPNRKRAP